MASIYEQHLDKNTANHVPLSPVSFVERRGVWRLTRCHPWPASLHLGPGA